MEAHSSTHNITPLFLPWHWSGQCQGFLFF
nr:MAG TPA: hypothetical protein [Caudoviricetes sp.]